MELTKEIREKLRAQIKPLGTHTQSSVASIVKTSQSTVGRWIGNNPPPSIKDGHGKRLLNFLKMESPEPMRDISGTPILSGSLTQIPVLAFSLAASYEPALESLDDFLANSGDETCQTANSKPGWFAVRVEGDSMSPTYPDGTLLVVAGGEYPQRGDIVIAKFADSGQVIIKRYQRRDDTITLESLNPDGQMFTWNVKKEPGKVAYLWPVVKAEIDMRRQRWEGKKSGSGGTSTNCN